MPKNTQKCRGYEIFQRMNYLFQIRDAMVERPVVATYYGNLIINLAKKSVLRIDPDLKRQICKKCRGPLLPGQTANIHIKKNKKQPTVLWKCKQCQNEKKYVVSREKKLWCEKPESLIEILDYGNSKSNTSTVKQLAEKKTTSNDSK